jgi:hypothetical protein
VYLNSLCAFKTCFIYSVFVLEEFSVRVGAEEKETKTETAMENSCNCFSFLCFPSQSQGSASADGVSVVEIPLTGLLMAELLRGTATTEHDN